ncbi:MAG: hypothetical protein KIS87_01420 [Phycisphaeraceae bacterium]|nr:hypothetical protein [Phycisphaeraceae bacterium]
MAGLVEGSGSGRRSRWLQGAARRFVVAIALAGAALVFPSCVAPEELERVRAEAAWLQQSLEADAVEWARRAESLPEGDPLREAATARQAASEASAAAFRAARSSLERAIAESNNPSDPIGQAVTAWVPEPARLPALLALGALGAAARAWRLKAGLASVARGIEAAMREDEEFRACFRRHADTFRATQTPTAKRVVDEATRDGLMLRLPV